MEGFWVGSCCSGGVDEMIVLRSCMFGISGLLRRCGFVVLWFLYLIFFVFMLPGRRCNVHMEGFP